MVIPRPIQSVLFPLLLLVSAGLYLYMGYFLERTQLSLLFTSFALLLGLSGLVMKFRPPDGSSPFWAGLLFRILLLGCFPSLSQDFFRFLWDGQLQLSGINPYTFTPNELMASKQALFPLAETLHQGMGALSASHYSNYPPVNQWCFALSAPAGKSSLFFGVLVLHVLILAADLILYQGLRKLLKILGQHPDKAYWYWLNPLVILELSGNLHFEGVMMAAMVWSLVHLLRRHYALSAVLFSIAAGIKLFPLILLPAVLFYLLKSSEKSGVAALRLPFKYGLLTLGGLVLWFLPYFDANTLEHFGNSVGLWFGKFEFNASIYYLVRAAGYAVKGYNIIETAAPWLSFISTILIITLAVRPGQHQPEGLMNTLMLSAFTYLMFATTVHPWYLVMPLVMSVTTSYRFMYLWSATAILSYHAYATADYRENLALTALAYLPVLLLFLWEVNKRRKSTAF